MCSVLKDENKVPFLAAHGVIRFLYSQMYLVMSLQRSSVLVPMVMKTLMTVDIQLLFQILCVSGFDSVSNLEMQA
jgi:hypothetical protein